MAIEEINYIQGNIPIETDLGSSIYEIVSNCICDKKNSEIQESKQYCTRTLHFLEFKQVVPVLFGTLYSGSNYAEVRFSKARKDKSGNLEIKLVGGDKKRLEEIQQEIKIRIKELMKKENGHKKQ